MQIKTEAIVLKTYKYSESALIAKIYTKEKGLLSFMVHGVRKKKSKYKASLFQVMQHLNLEVVFKEKANLHNIREISLSDNFTDLHTNIYKSTIAQFLGEVVFKTVREEEPNYELFSFIKNSISVLDKSSDKNIANFHLIFLVGLTRFLGFYPHNNFRSQNQYFCIETGEFEMIQTSQAYFDNEVSAKFSEIIKSNYSQMHEISMPSDTRKRMLHGLISFYQMQLPEMGEVKSLGILEVIFG